MRKLVLAAMIVTTGCSGPVAEAPPAAVAAGGYDLAAQRAKIARIEMKPDVSFLNAEERQVVNLLIQAAELMNPIYLRQRSASNPQTRLALQRIRRADQPLLLDMFDLHFGPWDTLDENHVFYGDKPMPPGAGLYPGQRHPDRGRDRAL
jgi:hypothetical protein